MTIVVRLRGGVAVAPNMALVIGIENAAVAFGGLALSLNVPAAPLNVPPVSVETIARLIVNVVVVPVVTTFETVTAPP